MAKIYRFTDWDYDKNDSFGSWEECKKLFDEAVKEDPKGRYSIYDTDTDEGVLFNEKCPEYDMS